MIKDVKYQNALAKFEKLERRVANAITQSRNGMTLVVCNKNCYKSDFDLRYLNRNLLK